MADNRAIGVFDSGLGGLTVVREIMKTLPNESIVYFGDTGRVPYGTRSEDTIKKYARQDERFLLTHNVKLIVAACGTVSAVAADTANELPVPFIEVVSSSVNDALTATKNGKIGVLATSATIKSGAHKRLILKVLPTAQVIENAGTLLVPIVEEGWSGKDDAVALEALRRYLKPMMEVKVDTIILGCTHFPVLEDAIKTIVGKDVTLVNMGVSAANVVKNYLEKNNALSDSESSSHSFFVSDKTDAFTKTAKILLGDNKNEINAVQVDVNSL